MSAKREATVPEEKPEKKARTSPAEYLVDTSALIRLLTNPAVAATWHRRLTAGLLATCAITEIELLYTVRSRAERARQLKLLQDTFCWVVMPEKVFKEAEELQGALTEMGAHRSAGPVDLLTAVTAREHGLELLHYDADFERIADITKQSHCWLAEPGSIN
ncbi:PIN domain nuclease [Actinoplanes sp. CA-131856]